MNVDGDRQTGRTTKLLREAIDRVEQGQDVFFVVHHGAMISYADGLVRSIAHDRQGFVAVGRGRFRLGDRWLRIVTKDADTRGLRPSGVVYDHLL